MNDFTLDFLKLTHSLDPTKSHAMMVCGHARPDQCQETVPHLGADDAHPCGASDASDPAAALASGFFCELLNATTTTTHGEVLVYGKEKIEFLEQTHAEDLAAGLTPQLPVLHLEIVEIEDLLEGLNLDYEDYDFGIGPSAAPETSGPVGSPSPALAPEGSRRRVARRLHWRHWNGTQRIYGDEEVRDVGVGLDVGVAALEVVQHPGLVEVPERRHVGLERGVAGRQHLADRHRAVRSEVDLDLLVLVGSDEELGAGDDLDVAGGPDLGGVADPDGGVGSGVGGRHRSVWFIPRQFKMAGAKALLAACFGKDSVLDGRYN